LSGLGTTRNLTPQNNQQILLQQLKTTIPQNSNQTNHGRHPSRYFLNEVLGTASKNFAKQSNNLGHGAAQGLGNQFTYSSVQGPPPGLKTSGTPPVSGGGMFAQGHGFTQGVGFGNRENDKLWDLHRSRPAAGSDGKRELLFPYHQYPPSSTATPSPGAMSFPYGSQGAAYQEPGNSQKQKKKGKKHRHANTPSSGGGVVDVADPSILQMRVGGNMASQGYTGQGQGGFNSVHGNPYRGW